MSAIWVGASSLGYVLARRDWLAFRRSEGCCIRATSLLDDDSCESVETSTYVEAATVFQEDA